MSKKVALTAMFTTFATVLSYVESFVPAIGIPGVKLGLANIAVILALYFVGTSEAFMCNVVRIIIVGAMFGSLFSILYSVAGAIFSFAVIVLLYKSDRFSIMTISICGGVFHNVGQLIIAGFTVETYSVMTYLPMLVISGMITGAIVGFVSGVVCERTANVLKLDNKMRGL